jgi:retron-type reverse transcriptase
MKTLIMELVEALGLSGSEVVRIISTAPARYKVYEIDKRDGTKRQIAQPSRELKAVQRYLLETKLSKFPIHASAMGYVQGRNIYQNARVHRNSRVILKLDFKNFFPSLKVRDWEDFISRSAPKVYGPAETRVFSKILFWSGEKNGTEPNCLSIGAPTSPYVSNMLMYEFDEAVSAITKGFGVLYTRYADDITLSGQETELLISVERKIRRFVAKMNSPRLLFNEEKRGIYARGARQMVTGLIITPQNLISVGRERKRTISSMLHRLSLEQLDLQQRSVLKGLLGFCATVEADFISRMRNKYGDGLLDSAMKFHAPLRKNLNLLESRDSNSD